MKKYSKLFYLLLIIPFLNSCLSRKDIRYMQPSENLKLTEEGYIPYNIPKYRVNKTDILKVTVITTPKGDAAQFYTSQVASQGGSAGATGGDFYYSGWKIDDNGEINVFGMGFIKAEGKTLDEIAEEIQNIVNKNFLPGKSQVRVYLDGLKYYVLSDLDGKTMQVTSQVYTLNILEMLASNGGLDRKVDRKHIRVYRKFPEGMKQVVIDVTREDIANSPYFYVQNGDMFLLETRGRSLNGFGNEPIQTVTTALSYFTTALSIYLLFTKI